MTISVFAKYAATAYPHTYAGTLHVPMICGGIPSDPKVAEGWIKSNLATTGDLLREQVAEVMAERGITAAEAAAIVDSNKHLNGFKRDENGLYIEGRQLKAAIKEAANIRWPSGRWSIDRNGKTRLLIKADDTRTSGKATRSFIAEHVFVEEDRLHLGVTDASGVNQRFVHTFRGSGIQYEEYVVNAEIHFTVAADAEFSDEQWALLWLTGEQQGIGATRSMGYGRYAVTRWARTS
jgi:hypothetical protein